MVGGVDWSVPLLDRAEKQRRAAVAALSGEPVAARDAERFVGVARDAEPAGSEWRQGLSASLGLDAATAALGAAESELQATDAAWRSQRVERWRSFCQEELGGGGRRLYRWIRGPLNAEPAAAAGATPPLGGLAGLSALHDGWQVWQEP